MSFRLRIWMPLVAVFMVLFSVSVVLLYEVPTVESRLSRYARNLTMAQAAATADAITGAEAGSWESLFGEHNGNSRRQTRQDRDALKRSLALYADSTNARIFVVDRRGEIVAREGSRNFSPSHDLIRKAAGGARSFEDTGASDVAVVPILLQGDLVGGVIFVSQGPGQANLRVFLRSGIEAAAIASVLGGGLLLLIATLLSRRIERLAYGARSIEQGDLSYRIEPDYYIDELRALAGSFNAMGARLENTFTRMEESNATLGTILDNLTEGVLATDLGGNVMFVNPAARTMLGVDREETLKQLPDPWREFDLPDAVARCAKHQECGEARVRGKETFLRVNIEHLPHFDEHKGGVLVVIQDLSEGLRLEANQQRFLANAAHELKTPITTILGSAELLLTGDDDPEQRHRFLEHIHSEAERMQRLSDTLLRLARTGLDQREPDLHAVDLEPVVRRAAERMESLAQSAGVELSVEGREAGVCADEEWLEQAFLIVLNNAVQHSDRGDRVWLRLSGGAVEVEDEGEGISEADLPHVFERFYRQGRGSQGFGLGLPICKELVERMGGEVSISSREGAGTVVRIELPESPQPNNEAEK